ANFQTLNNRFVIKNRDKMKVMNLRGLEAMRLKAGICRAQRPQKIFVPLATKIRMQSSLHQHAGTAQLDRLVDFFANLVDRAYVSVRRAGPAIECAESTDHVADIRVIDVAIDDVGDNVAGMTALPNFIGGGSDGRDVVRL